MPSPLRIYFAAPLRGGASFDRLARRIAFLESFGQVLTRHMASPATADLGLADDRAIHDHDQRLLAESHVFVADLASPSTGTGFMAARAVASGKPTLCLYPAGQPISAMIAGCPGITTRAYADDAAFQGEVRAFLLAHAAAFAGCAFPAPKVVLAGPPGSGKGTLGKKLMAATGAAHVSTGELLRELLASGRPHPHAATISACMQAGKLVPAELMRDLVLERLGQPDCRMFGFLLDGYPPSRADLENLTTHGVVPDLVLFLECSHATSAARQVSRAARSTDTPEKARARLEVWDASDAGFEALASSWFPDSIVARLDAEGPPEEVERVALETLRSLFGDPRRGGSFWTLPPFKQEEARSTRVHFHVDAKDVFALRDIAREIHVRDRSAQGRMKIYPIVALHLGPQAARWPVYRQMPNFHEIEGSETEAFITGRLGDGDPALVNSVLAAAARHGAMVELEEYAGEWTLGLDGVVVTDSRYDPLPLDRRVHGAFERDLCRDIPRLELHHGFDLPRQGDALPIPLPELMAACAAAGLDNGGWFLFANERAWAYRSNEFSNDEVAVAERRLEAQARALARLLVERGHACPVSFSLERVHAIWIV